MSTGPTLPISNRALQRGALFLLLIAILAFLAAYPTAMLLWGSLHTGQPGASGDFTLHGYQEALSADSLRVLGNTVLISGVKTIFSMILAVSLGFLVARTDMPGRRTLELLITLPFFIPPMLTATAWAMLGNARVGPINMLWRWLTGSHEPLVNMYSYGGMIWHMMQYSTTFIFLFVVEAFRAMDPALEEASRMSGASRWTTTRKVTLVLLAPVLAACALLSFMRGIESFDSALILGYPAKIIVLTTRIFISLNQNVDVDYGYATAISFVTLLLMLVLVGLQWAALRKRSFATVTGKGFTPRLIPLGGWRWPAFGFCMLFFVISVVLPVGQLIVGSLFQYFGFYGWKLLTLDHYREVCADGRLWRAFGNTMLLGLIGATATMTLGSLTAWVVARTKWKARWLVAALAWLPWMMPGMVLGAGLLWSFALLPQWVPIYGTIWALFLAYVALGTPVAVRVMSAAYGQISTDLEECSRTSGAGFWRTMWHIMLALAWPSFMAGWVLVLFGILRELSASILLYSAGSEVLSISIIRLWTNGKMEEVSVIGLLFILLVIAFRLIQYRFLERGVKVR